jgi:hypothetical protein
VACFLQPPADFLLQNAPRATIDNAALNDHAGRRFEADECLL